MLFYSSQALFRLKIMSWQAFQYSRKCSLRDGPALILNGAGIRDKFFFKIYVAALYLPRAQSNRLKLLQEFLPSRMLMHIVYNEESKGKLVNAWVEGFQSNANDAEYRLLEARLALFNQMLTYLCNGDCVAGLRA